MANITTQTIRVDLSTDKTIPTAFTHQNDTARTLEFSMYNKGVPYDMTGNTVKFAYKSPIVDGQYSVITGSSMASGTVSGNKVTVTLPSAYTAISGVGMLTMIITPTSGTVRPVNIRLVVQKSADGDDTVMGASDFPESLFEYMDDWLAENEPTEIANLKSDLKQIGWPNYTLEQGDIYLSTNGWSYYNSSTRVRIKEGTSVHLYPGTIIGIGDYSNARMYIGWKTPNNSYDKVGWLHNDYVTKVEGDYTVLLTLDPESNVTPSTFEDMFYIIQPNTLRANNDSVMNFLDEAREQTANRFNSVGKPKQIVNGVTYTIDKNKVTINGTATATNNTRFYFGQTLDDLELNDGDTVTLSFKALSGTTSATTYMSINNVSGTVINMNQRTCVTFTYNSEAHDSWFFYCDNGTVFNNYTLEVQIENGSVPTHIYPKYIGKDAYSRYSLNVINTATNKSENVIQTMFDSDAGTFNGISYVFEDNVITLNGTANAEATKYFVFGRQLKDVDIPDGSIVALSYRIISGDYTGKIYVSLNNDASTNIRFDYRDIGYFEYNSTMNNLYFYITTGSSFNNFKFEIQLRVGNDDYIVLSQDEASFVDLMCRRDVNRNANWKTGLVNSVAHRGLSNVAPENTIPAYIAAKLNGFDKAECDISFTSDNVPVLLHDPTINRTGRNDDGSGISQTISINDITLEQAQTYDFGIWKSKAFAGTRIPTLEQFIIFCKNIGVLPYIELKTDTIITEAQVQNCVDIVKKCGMSKKVTWISFSSSLLEMVKNYDEFARIGLVCNNITNTELSDIENLQTGKNEVFLDVYYTVTDSEINLAIAQSVPVEVWTITSNKDVTGLNPYITGYTANDANAGRILYNETML